MERYETILIKNGTVVLGRDVVRKDLLVRGEKIAEVAGKISCRADMTIDADNLFVFPGAIDNHVHFNDEFMETISVHDYYTGTRAAAFGGVTCIIDFSNQKPGGSLIDTITDKKREAQGKALIDWGVHPVITDPSETTINEIEDVVRQGSPTVKCYMTYRDEGLMIEKEDLVRISSRLEQEGGMLLLHAEDNDMIEKGVTGMIESGNTGSFYHAKSRPPAVERKAIDDAIDICRRSGGRVFIVHMSVSDGMGMLEDARAEGLNIHAETCTHYLVFDENMLAQHDGIKWICSPPLRDKGHQEALWEGIADGRISLVSSDDAAYSWEAKLLGKDRFDKCPNGIPGVEPRLNILYSEGVAKERLSLTRFVELISSEPAEMFGLSPDKGRLLPGSDADIVLFDPRIEWIMNNETLHMNTDWSAYEDINITGKIIKVFSRGELIIDEKKCLAEKGRGRYLNRILNNE